MKVFLKFVLTIINKPFKKIVTMSATSALLMVADDVEDDDDGDVMVQHMTENRSFIVLTCYVH